MSPPLQIGSALVDLARLESSVDGGTVRLSPQEVAIIQAFRAAVGPTGLGTRTATLSREQLYREAWGYSRAPRGRALDYAIRRLRSKLGDETAGGRALETLRGSGYRLTWSEQKRPEVASPVAPSLFGREEIIARIQSLLAESAIVTLVGSGGIGKTQVARAVVAQTSDAHWREVHPQAPLDLPDGNRLVVLDGCEVNLVAVRAALKHLRQSQPLRPILCTSRERLSVRDEVVVDVSPLERAAAVALLTAQLRRLGGPELPPERLAPICEALDDHPLALCLVAPRLRSLPPERLAERLGSDSGGATLHADLDDIVQFSWERLAPEARVCMARLAALPQPFTLEDAEACLPPETDLLETIESLVDRSMLVASHSSNDGLKYRVLKPLRGAIRRLAASPASEPKP